MGGPRSNSVGKVGTVKAICWDSDVCVCVCVCVCVRVRACVRMCWYVVIFINYVILPREELLMDMTSRMHESPMFDLNTKALCP